MAFYSQKVWRVERQILIVVINTGTAVIRKYTVKTEYKLHFVVHNILTPWDSVHSIKDSKRCVGSTIIITMIKVSIVHVFFSFIFLSVCLSVCMYVCVCLYLCQLCLICDYVSVCLSVCLSVYLSTPYLLQTNSSCLRRSKSCKRQLKMRLRQKRTTARPSGSCVRRTWVSRGNSASPLGREEQLARLKSRQPER